MRRGAVRERRVFDAQGRLREVERLDGDGAPVWSARFDDYQPVGSVPFAHAIRVEATRRSARAELVLSGVELNPALPADIFRLQPAGVRRRSRRDGGIAWADSRRWRCAAVAARRLHEQSLSGCRRRRSRSSTGRSASRPGRSIPPSATRVRAPDHRRRLRRRCSSTTTCAALRADPRAARARCRRRAALPDGRVAYRFRLRAGVLFQDDPGFALGARGRAHARGGGRRRRLPADADRRPGDREPRGRHLREDRGLRASSPSASRRCARRIRASRQQRIHEQYAAAGGIAGVRVARPRRARDRARRAVSADPLLVRDALHGAGSLGGGRVLRRRGGARLLRGASGRRGPVPRDPLRQAEPDRARPQSELVRAPAPGMGRAGRRSIPSEGEPEDAALGRLDPAYVGRPLPVPRPRRVPDREGGHPHLQQVPAGLLRRLGHPAGELRQDRARGRALGGDGGATACSSRSRSMPDVYYIGFNMDDPVVGSAGRRDAAASSARR